MISSSRSSSDSFRSGGLEVVVDRLSFFQEQLKAVHQRFPLKKAGFIKDYAEFNALIVLRVRRHGDSRVYNLILHRVPLRRNQNSSSVSAGITYVRPDKPSYMAPHAQSNGVLPICELGQFSDVAVASSVGLASEVWLVFENVVTQLIGDVFTFQKSAQVIGGGPPREVDFPGLMKGFPGGEKGLVKRVPNIVERFGCSPAQRGGDLLPKDELKNALVGLRIYLFNEAASIWTKEGIDFGFEIIDCLISPLEKFRRLVKCV